MYKKLPHYCLVAVYKKLLLRYWLCWGLTTRQPSWVILCRLPEKGSNKTEEIVEEMKDRDREERETEMKVEETEGIKHSPSILTCYEDSRPCPTVSQYQLGHPSDVRYTTPSHHPTTPSATIQWCTKFIKVTQILATYIILSGAIRKWGTLEY